MALSGATQWRVYEGGSDNNGGGFVFGASGTNRSQQNSAHATLTTASTVHTTTTQINVHASNYTVTSQDVGNILQITGGTATAGWYQITAADVPNNRWTVDRAAGTSGQTVAGAMGGALASPGRASLAHVANNTIWIKKHTTQYTLASATQDVATGCVNLKSGSGTMGVTSIIGFETTEGDNVQATIGANGSITSFTIIQTGNNCFVGNLILDGNSRTTSRGVGNGSAVTGSAVHNCIIKRFTNSAASQAGNGNGLWNCLIQDNTTAVAVLNCHMTSCAVIDNTAGGVSENMSGGVFTYSHCIIARNTGVGITKDRLGACFHCSFYNNTTIQFSMSQSYVRAENCASWGGTIGFDTLSTTAGSLFSAYTVNCAAGNASTENYAAELATAAKVNCLTLTAQPFETPDVAITTITGAFTAFKPNGTSGGGASLRRAATDGSDIGAVQSTGGAGSPLNRLVG